MPKNGMEFPDEASVDGKKVAANIWDVASFYREAPDMRSKLPD